MTRVGLLIEDIYHRGQPVHLGTAHPSAWPALRQLFQTNGVDFLAAEFNPVDADGGVLVFASRSFTCRPAPAIARLLKIKGEDSRELEAKTAAGTMLGIGRAEGATVTASEKWTQLIQFGD